MWAFRSYSDGLNYKESPKMYKSQWQTPLNKPIVNNRAIISIQSSQRTCVQFVLVTLGRKNTGAAGGNTVSVSRLARGGAAKWASRWLIQVIRSQEREDARCSSGCSSVTERHRLSLISDPTGMGLWSTETEANFIGKKKVRCWMNWETWKLIGNW